MKPPIAVGNVIVVRDHEPKYRMVGVVIEVDKDEDYATCVMLSTKLNRETGKYKFDELEADYLVDLRSQKYEVPELPSLEVPA